jgi:hypothetical protein
MVIRVATGATSSSPGVRRLHMRIGHLARTLGSGAALYVVMAACGGSDRAAETGDAGAAELVDAFVDEVASPVKDAKADPVTPDVAVEQCDKVVKYQGSADYYVAEHAYPGKTIAQLSAVRVVITPSPAQIEGYNHQQTLPHLRDGFGAVLCSPVSAGPSPYSITFVL